MIAPFFALTKNTPASKRCWEVRVNRACSYCKNNRENKIVPFDRNSPTLLGGAGPVEYAESANIFVNSEYMESANDCILISTYRIMTWE